MTTTTAIAPADFRLSSQFKGNRDEWTVGALQHVIAALKGAPVIVIVGGLALQGAHITASFYGDLGPRVHIETAYGEGKARTTDYPVSDVGAIIPMRENGTPAKYIALDAYRKQVGDAILKAQGDHPECGWGAWTGEVVEGDRVAVRYEPGTGNAYYEDKWGERGSWTITV